MSSLVLPDAAGRFGRFGGRYVPETLMQPLLELEECYARLSCDPSFRSELDSLLRDFAGRPTPLYEARRLSAKAGGARIFLKREDLCHTGSHKINNTLGQGLLAVRMGKRRLIAETGAGQHGVATATAAALLGLECTVFMGEEDAARQAPNLQRMRLMGAEVEVVRAGSRTLKDAVNAALREWVATVEDTHYCMGSVVGPHPFPRMVRDFQGVIGREARQQFLKKEGRLPDCLVACVGGGSNSLGLFHPFLQDRLRGRGPRMVGVEAGGKGPGLGEHAASLCRGVPGTLHGSLSYLLQDEEGQVLPTHSISAGLDYPGVGPEHAWLKETGIAEYVAVGDREALEAARELTLREGILPALESAHAVAFALELAGRMSREEALLVCLSGRGDKDMEKLAEAWMAGSGEGK